MTLIEPAYTYRAHVTRVVDGDTVDLMVDLGFSTHVSTRVRLLGVNTPETYGVKKDSVEFQKGMQAKALTESLLTPVTLGETVIVQTELDRTEKYGRYLARIWTKQTTGGPWICVNDKLIEAGYGKQY